MATVTESCILLAPTTDAVDLGDIPTVDIPRGLFATVTATGISGAEVFNVYTANQDGTNDIIWKDGAEGRITASANPIIIGPGPVRVTFDKTASDDPVGLEVLL